MSGGGGKSLNWRQSFDLLNLETDVQIILIRLFYMSSISKIIGIVGIVTNHLLPRVSASTEVHL